MNKSWITYFKDYLIVAFIVISSTFFLWLPYLFKTTNWFGLNIKQSNFEYIYKNYDGPLYIVVAKTLYNIKAITNLKLELNLSPEYFSAHLPFYPILIRLTSPLVGYLKAMIGVNFITSIFLAIFFYFIINKLKITQKPLILTAVFLFLPRFLIIRSIGAPESLFILMILISLYFFEIKKYFWAGLFGALSVLTKTPGILLFPAFIITIIDIYLKTKRINWFWVFILLIPFSLFLLFCFYAVQYGNFWAYFNKESLVPLVFPFSVFNFQKIWVGTAWLEDVILYFFIYLITVVYLKDFKYRSFYYFALIFFIATTFVQHRDISRYSLPIWPLTCIAFAQFLTSKKFLIVFLILLPAIYLYAWNYLTFNILPISNWLPFL